MDTPLHEDKREPARRPMRLPTWLPAMLFAAVLGIGLILIMTLSIPSGPTPLRVGDVAKQNIRSPRRVSYVSQIKTRRAKEAAAATIPDVYDYDPGVAQQQRAQAQILFSGIANIRADTSIASEQKRDRIQRLADGIVSITTTQAILALDSFMWPAVVSESVRVLDDVMRDRVRQSDLSSVRARLPGRFSSDLTPEQLQVAVAIVGDLLKPNEIYNPTETARQRKDAQDKIEPVREIVEKGEIVVREGNVVTDLDLEKLEALGLQQARSDWPDVVSAILLVLTLVIILSTYLNYFHPTIFTGGRALLLAAGILVFVLAARLAGSERAVEGVSWIYLVPFAVLPVLVGMLIDQQLAVVVAVILGILAGYTGGRSLDVAVMVMLGGAAGALHTRHIQRLSAFLWLGMLVALVNLVVVIAFFLPAPDRDTTAYAAASIMALGGGALAAATTAILFAPLGNILGATTVLHLLELAHPSHPLFRRLLLEAPGTYHHSVIISTLAEGAAEAVGANALLLRVGAYYHDIGKVLHPYFFIENQINGNNIHDTMDPLTSAKAVMAHVPDGLELARKYRLPKPIQDMIPQHHGTKLTGYFYAQAQAKGLPITEADFRYPGPKPQTKEAGILLLADGVEAAVRASRDHSQEAIERIVREMVAAQVMDGQLDECDLTLKDLEKIRQAFSTILLGVYHPRIEYPAPQPAVVHAAAGALPPPGVVAAPTVGSPIMRTQSGGENTGKRAKH